MNIGYLGAGAWGTALASLLATGGHRVAVWDKESSHLKTLDKTRRHPKLEGFVIPSSVKYAVELEEALEDANMIVESVTSEGVRPVFENIFKIKKDLCSIVLTSKGIEQKTGLLFPEVLVDVLGEENRSKIGCLSGPSLADEIAKGMPASLVCSAYDKNVMKQIKETFNTSHFRVYPNSDINGVSFGGAIKNIIAIACGISDGLGFGDNAKAALMTRGLHEIRKLSVTKGANPETLNGLSGLGDLFVTCSSILSRNYRFGQLIAKGYSLEKAKEEIGMVVEGAYSCISALELGKKYDIAVPITEATYAILYQGMPPKKAVNSLLQRAVKEEHL
ncbi:MAG: NAD(P)-dependent glycerol-3-phosphate dehydrogenase [Gammaproteobacteria bacterium]|nr:NAD(P)-dependent glycerol-3-phosphate dehydrogenase [Gammaproteobacteria bacterium]